MLRLMKADLYRLFHSKGVYLILLAVIGMAGMVLSFKFFPAIGPNETSYNLAVAIKNTSWNSKIAFQGALATYPFLIYLFIGFFSMNLGYEFSQKCYKNTLTSGVSRTLFCLSKNLTQLIMVTLGTILNFGSIFVFSFFKYGMNDIDIEALINNMFFAVLVLALGIMVIFSLANILLIITSSSVMVTAFLAIAPLMIPIIGQSTGWRWLNYFDFVSLAQSMAFYELYGKALLPYIAVNIVLILCSTIISISVMKRKEF